MLNRILTFYIFALCLFCLKHANSLAPGALGPADIDLKSVELCDNPEKYPNKVVIGRKKVNRTHEALDMDINLKDVITPNIVVYVNFAKWGDGGYKPNFYVIEEPDACTFMFKWINQTISDILVSGGEPPNCPIPAKQFILKKYLVDYTKLPQEMIYGKFKGDIILRKEGVDILCFRIFVDSKPKQMMG